MTSRGLRHAGAVFTTSLRHRRIRALVLADARPAVAVRKFRPPCRPVGDFRLMFRRINPVAAATSTASTARSSFSRARRASLLPGASLSWYPTTSPPGVLRLSSCMADVNGRIQDPVTKAALDARVPVSTSNRSNPGVRRQLAYGPGRRHLRTRLCWIHEDV
jgi:hypothetical protein